MRFVLTEEEVAVYKQCVSACSLLAGSGVLNSIEQCIELRTGKNEIILSSLNTGSSYISLRCPCTVQKQGSLYISFTSLLTMSKSINKSSLIIELKGNDLIYTVPVLGSIKESIFHSQGGFTHKGLAQDESASEELVVEHSSILSTILKTISNSSLKGKSVRIKCSKEYTDIYGVYSSGGCLRFRDYIEAYKDIDILISSNLLKLLPILGNCLSLKTDKTNHIIEIFSEMGIIRSYTETGKVGEAISMESILKLRPCSSLEIKCEDLDAAIKWQSYKSLTGDSVFLSLGKELRVHSPRMDASKLATESFSGEETLLSIAITDLRTVVGSIRSDVLCLETRQVPVGNKKVSVLSVKASRKDSGWGIATINEQVLL